MQITVKSTKCLSKGTNDYGPWALYKFISTDDKAYTTLAEGAEVIKAGAVIEPDAITLDEKHEGQFQFKKFTLISTPEHKAPEPGTIIKLLEVDEPPPPPDHTPLYAVAGALLLNVDQSLTTDPLYRQIYELCRLTLPEAPTTPDQDWDKMKRSADPATKAQILAIGEESRKAEYEPLEVRQYAVDNFGKADSRDLSGAEADQLLTAIKEKKIKKVEAPK